MDVVRSIIVQTFNDNKSVAMITYGMTTFAMTMVIMIIALGNDTRCSISFCHIMDVVTHDLWFIFNSKMHCSN
jgi:hypothetical protein